MGRRKQLLIARIVRRIKHLVSPQIRAKREFAELRKGLALYGTRVLARLARGLDILFSEWDYSPEMAHAFAIGCTSVYFQGTLRTGLPR